MRATSHPLRSYTRWRCGGTGSILRRNLRRQPCGTGTAAPSQSIEEKYFERSPANETASRACRPRTQENKPSEQSRIDFGSPTHFVHVFKKRSVYDVSCLKRVQMRCGVFIELFLDPRAAEPLSALSKSSRSYSGRSNACGHPS